MLSPIPLQQKSEIFLPIAPLKHLYKSLFVFLCTVSYCISVVEMVTERKTLIVENFFQLTSSEARAGRIEVRGKFHQ